MANATTSHEMVSISEADIAWESFDFANNQLLSPIAKLGTFINSISFNHSQVKIAPEPVTEEKKRSRRHFETYKDEDSHNSRTYDIIKIANELSSVPLETGTLVIAPQAFLLRILQSRGYPVEFTSGLNYRKKPSAKQLEDYTNDMISYVRNSDINQIKVLLSKGVSMSACNRFSESIIHLAARRSNLQTLQFLISNGGDLSIVDDCGRTPLHDAFWRTDLNYETITYLLTLDINLLMFKDSKGATPLEYVSQKNWIDCCVYLYNMQDVFWPYNQ